MSGKETSQKIHISITHQALSQIMANEQSNNKMNSINDSQKLFENYESFLDYKIQCPMEYNEEKQQKQSPTEKINDCNKNEIKKAHKKKAKKPEKKKIIKLKKVKRIKKAKKIKKEKKTKNVSKKIKMIKRNKKEKIKEIILPENKNTIKLKGDVKNFSALDVEELKGNKKEIICQKTPHQSQNDKIESNIEIIIKNKTDSDSEKLGSLELEGIIKEKASQKSHFQNGGEKIESDDESVKTIQNKISDSDVEEFNDLPGLDQGNWNKNEENFSDTEKGKDLGDFSYSYLVTSMHNIQSVSTNTNNQNDVFMEHFGYNAYQHN